jgi:hypothetical protein
MRGLAGHHDAGIAGLATDAALPAAVVETLRWASRGMVTANDDDPPATSIEGRLEPGFVLSRHMEVGQDGTWTGVVIPFINEILLENADRGLDALGLTHNVIGRPITIRLAAGSKDAAGRIVAPPLSEFGAIWQGRVGSISYDDNLVRLSLQADAGRLDRPMQRSTYGGTGGLDGTEELQGQTKPECIGRIFQAEPVQIDPFLLIYQLRAGPMFEIERVTDMGVPLEITRDFDTYEQLIALIPEGTPDEVPDLLIGQVATCLAEGVFRCGGQPAGRLLVDGRGRGDHLASHAVREPFSDGTYFTDGTGFVNGRRTMAYAGGVRAITNAILKHYADVGDEDVDENQILAGTDMIAGLYLPAGGQMTCREALSRLMQSGLMFVGRNRWGKWVVHKIAPAGTVGTLVIDQAHLVRGSLRRVDLPYRQPWSRWRVGYAPRWATLSDSEIAGAVGDGSRGRLKTPLSFADRTDSTMKALWPDQRVGMLETVLAAKADAATIRDELFALYTKDRQAYTLSAYGISGQADLGDTVTVRVPKLGMDAGKNLLVIGVEEDGRERATRLNLFG